MIKQRAIDTSAKLGQVSDQDIRLLKVFRTVTECGGFAAAETELGIGRSTISIHIANLESRLKLKLCRRGRAGFALTDDGAEVYELMKGLFSSMEQFRSGVNALHVALSGELNVIASDTICLQQKSRIPEIVAQFSSVAEDVQLVLDVREMMAIEQMVLNDEADIGFAHVHREFDGLNYVYLYKSRCFLYCSQSHPLSELSKAKLAKAVQKARLVHSGVKTSPKIGEQLVGMNKSAVSYSYESRLAMIMSGAYIGYLPDFFAAEFVASGELLRLLPEKKRYDLDIAAIARSHSKGSRARDLFMDIVRNHHM